MNLRNTLIVALILLLLGGYAYFIEYKGTQKKEEKEKQKKTLLEVKKADLSKIEIETADQKIDLLPSGEAWRITAPISGRADDATVNRFTGAVEKLQYDQVLEEKPGNLEQFQLTKPKMTIRLFLKKGNAEKSLMIGAKSPVGNLYYFKMNNDPRVYLVDSSVGDLANTTLLDLRDKRLTDFSSDKVQSLSFHNGALDLQFSKEGGVWKMKTPVDSAAADSEITSFLSTLEFLKATRFIDEASPNLTEYGLQEPFATVDIVQEKGLEQKIAFGKDQNNQYFCRVEGNPSISAIDSSLSTYFDKKLDDWREKKVVVMNRFDAQELKVKIADKEYLFKKGKEEKWNEESPAKGELDGDKVLSVLEQLENAEINKYGDKPNIDDAPVMEVFVTLKDWQDKIAMKHLSFGAPEGDLQPIKNADYSTIIFANSSIQKKFQDSLMELKPNPPAPPQTNKKSAKP
jgi:Domain of unknown function (DUF4340)